MGEVNNDFTLSNVSNANFTITTSSTTAIFYVDGNTGLKCADPIETMKAKFAVLSDKFLEKYRNESI